MLCTERSDGYHVDGTIFRQQRFQTIAGNHVHQMHSGMELRNLFRGSLFSHSGLVKMPNSNYVQPKGPKGPKGPKALNEFRGRMYFGCSRANSDFNARSSVRMWTTDGQNQTAPANNSVVINGRCLVCYAEGGTRTRTTLSSLRILSPVCLPVSPPRLG